MNNNREGGINQTNICISNYNNDEIAINCKSNNSE